jgi:hypothetical protein
MSTAIATETTDKLAKMMRLIFSSDRPGEILAAVDATKRLMASNGVDHHWLANRITAVAHADDRAANRHGDDGDDDQSNIWFAYHRRHRLTARERDFIERIRTWRGPISAKQRIWLHDLCDRLEAG